MLLMAIVGKDDMYKPGCWNFTKSENLGYLNQHYSDFKSKDTVI
ncbi:MAG: hypothetical protein ACJA0H_001930 [Francisellaceae bacterium]|jgi:hypothetical protein